MQKNYRIPRKQLKIAVIGSGIAGMSAAWLLNKAHLVTLFEIQNRLGGHSNTVDVTFNKTNLAVDTGFIVFNDINYPNLTRLLDHIHVTTQSSNMSFSVSSDNGTFEYGTRNLNALLGQRSNIISPQFWSILRGIKRFFPEATNLVSANKIPYKKTLGEFLAERNYSSKFINHFILPMGGAIWSTKPSEILEQPANTFLTFFASHGLLRFRNRFLWKTVSGGSRQYVTKLTESYKNRINLESKIKTISRSENGIEIWTPDGKTSRFDAVVIATHANQALSLLQNPSAMERELLGAFRYTNNSVILHSDSRLMPKRQKIWSSWNVLGDQTNGISVTYWMNLLQSIRKDLQIYVSINPNSPPKDNLVHKTFNYSHPFFDTGAWKAQKKLWQLQGENHTWFCGSYFGYGFHEDALQSALGVAEELGGIKRPWTVDNDNERVYIPNRIG